MLLLKEVFDSYFLPHDIRAKRSAASFAVMQGPNVPNRAPNTPTRAKATPTRRPFTRRSRMA